MRRPTAPHRRLGFTLIELLVVIMILVLLVGLLVPAIGAAVRNAKNAAVTAEINQLGHDVAFHLEPYRSSTADARSAVRSPTSATRTHSRSRPSVPFGPRSPHNDSRLARKASRRS